MLYSRSLLVICLKLPNYPFPQSSTWERLRRQGGLWTRGGEQGVDRRDSAGSSEPLKGVSIPSACDGKFLEALGQERAVLCSLYLRPFGCYVKACL